MKHLLILAIFTRAMTGLHNIHQLSPVRNLAKIKNVKYNCENKIVDTRRHPQTAINKHYETSKKNDKK